MTQLTASLLLILPLLVAAQGNWNIVNIEIYGSSKCSSVSNFFRRHLLKTWNLFGSSGRLNVSYHPIPRTYSLDSKGNDSICPNGNVECLLNALQECLIDRKPKFNDHVEPLVCVQGKRDLKTAIKECIETNEVWKSSAKELELCAEGTEGGNLLSLHYARRSWHPWIEIEGERNRNAEKHLWEELCNNYLKPKPKECETKI